MATETFVDFTGLQYYDGKLKEKIASEYATKSELPSNYQGATSSANGVSGLIPAAPSADRDKFLKGDGTWENIDAIKTIDGNLECFNSSNIQTSNPDNWEANSVIVGPVIFVTGAVTGQSENNIWTNISPVIIQEDPHFNNSIEARRLTGTATGIESDVFYSSTDNTTTCWVIDLNTATFRGYPIFAFEGEITTENQYSQKLIKNGVIIIQNDGLPYTHSDKSIPFEYVEKTGWAIKGQVDFHYISSNSTYTISLDITIYTPAAWVIANNPSINIVSTKTDNRILNQNINLSCLLDNIDEKIEIIKHECNSIKQYKGAGISYNGVAGLVPAAPSVDRDKFLKGDGTWAEVVQPAIVTSSELSTGTDATVRTISPKVIHDYVAEVDSNAVHTTGNETIAGVKTFTGQITSTTSYFRSIGNIDKTATGTGEQEAVIFNTADKNNVAICQLNAERNLAGAFQELRFRNWNINNLWSDFRLRCTDDNKYWLTMAAKDGMSFGLAPTDSSLAIPTTAWIRSATGNFALNAATATKATQDGSGNVITATYATKAEMPSDYVGATSSANGVHGLVPAAAIAEKDCFLCGDGTWDAISGMTNAQIDTAMANVGYVGDIDPSLLTSITNAEIDALFA